ncbi:MAG: hypothetical protein L6Q92_02630 [Phycisphaerae bacterium]|nr:hypothetical protein [Phycisphaerae bacterium]
MCAEQQDEHTSSSGDPDRADDSFLALTGETIVLDTAGPILFIGTLREVRPDGFWLDNADVHDCSEGHANKELYVCEARQTGVRPNRRSVFVVRQAVISASRLSDAIVD